MVLTLYEHTPILPIVPTVGMNVLMQVEFKYFEEYFRKLKMWKDKIDSK